MIELFKKYREADDIVGQSLERRTGVNAGRSYLVHNVCKGNWSRGSNDTPEANKMKHYKKHGFEVGANSPAEYTRKAMNYANDVLSKGRRVRTARISGYTDGVVRYYYNRKYIDLVRNGTEHLIVSFGRR